MSVIAVCVFLCMSGCFHGSSAGQNITKEPGENVTLMCRTENNHTLIVLEWSRDGLGTKKVFVFKDGKPFPPRQHESYRNRVFLKDSQMKDGNLSVVLENLMINDTGTYECRVKHKNDPQREPKLISTIRLSVVPPGDPSPGDPSPGQQGGLSPGGITGIVLAVLVLVPAAVGLWIYRKKKGPNQSSSGSNKQQNPEEDGLNSDP